MTWSKEKNSEYRRVMTQKEIRASWLRYMEDYQFPMSLMSKNIIADWWIAQNTKVLEEIDGELEKEKIDGRRTDALNPVRNHDTIIKNRAYNRGLTTALEIIKKYK